MTTAATRTGMRSTSTNRNGRLLVALPETSISETQDAEWCVVKVEDEWRQVRFHDYEHIFSIPGLYEKVIYDILQCNSPDVVRGLMEAELEDANVSPNELRVLDLGAGNGMVGEELANMGTEFIVGVDIIQEAAEATERDRPELYSGYHVVDLTALGDGDREVLERCRFNALTCVAALGFGDIPTKAFTTAFNLVDPGGWVAFNIKEGFLGDEDESGFAGLIRHMVDDGRLELRRQKRYQHRLAMNREPLHYVAIVGVKRRDV